jgi:flavin-binding protein dodecin
MKRWANGPGSVGNCWISFDLASLQKRAVRIVQRPAARQCLNVTAFASLEHAGVMLTAWQHGYNHRRPHGSLGYMIPIEFAQRGQKIGAAKRPRPGLNHSRKEAPMSDHVYKLLELTGTSATGIEDAVGTAINKASKTVRNIHWFQVIETRGHVIDGKVAHWQVTLKVGFTLDE